MGQVGGWKQKSSAFFLKKKIHILPVGSLTCSAKDVLFQPPMYRQQNNDEGVRFYPVIYMYVYLYYMYWSCKFVFVRIYLQIQGLF